MIAGPGLGVPPDEYYTTRAAVADVALAADTTVINDVSGGPADPGMAAVAHSAG